MAATNLTDLFTDVADAIREKEGSTEAIAAADFPTRILAIETGGEELPAEAFNISGDCIYRFPYNYWNWYIEAYGNKVNTSDITNCSYMFQNTTELTNIPFEINIASDCKNFSYMFQKVAITEAPYIRGSISNPTTTGSSGGSINMSNMFNYCKNLRYIPDDYFSAFASDAFWEAQDKYVGANASAMFQYCHSLRKLPDISKLTMPSTSNYNKLSQNGFYGCYALDEIRNIPVANYAYETLTGNSFTNAFTYCTRIKSLTFATDADGAAKTVYWGYQTIDLTSYVGYGRSDSYFTGYNSGLTIDTKVTDDASYQALKDSDDWWTLDVNYSRYNHDSAVETINSLPDAGFYIYNNSNYYNIIKFKGTAGALTDGGAINTLTDEEIAVATDKGWTVTIV